MPPVLSTGGITTLPAPPPPGPFDARPGTYAPHYNRGYRGGYGYGTYGYGVPYGTIFYDTYPPPSAPGEQQATAPPPPAAEAPLPEPPKAAVVHGPDTFYVIAGCYAGNRPPNPDRLPKSCDAAKLKTIQVR